MAWGMKREGPRVSTLITCEPTSMRNTVTNEPWEDGSQVTKSTLLESLPPSREEGESLL